MLLDLPPELFEHIMEQYLMVEKMDFIMEARATCSRKTLMPGNFCVNSNLALLETVNSAILTAMSLIDIIPTISNPLRLQYLPKEIQTSCVRKFLNKEHRSHHLSRAIYGVIHEIKKMHPKLQTEDDEIALCLFNTVWKTFPFYFGPVEDGPRYGHLGRLMSPGKFGEGYHLHEATLGACACLGLTSSLANMLNSSRGRSMSCFGQPLLAAVLNKRADTVRMIVKRRTYFDFIIRMAMQIAAKQGDIETLMVLFDQECCPHFDRAV